MFDEVDPDARAEHEARTAGYSRTERDAFNDGYLWASGDSLAMMREVLDDSDLSDADKVGQLNTLLAMATMPLIIAGLAVDKDYVQ